MKTDRPIKLKLLLEHAAGVMEVEVAMSRSNGRIELRPVGSVAVWGSLKATDPDVLAEAFELLSWAYRNRDVFQGRVVRNEVT